MPKYKLSPHSKKTNLRTSNLKRKYPLIHKSLSSKRKVSTRMEIVGRVKFLQEKMNGSDRKTVVSSVTDELLEQWKNFDLPTRNRNSIYTRILNLVKKFDDNQKHGRTIDEPFDIRDHGRKTLTKEDELFYQSQMQQDQQGYGTNTKVKVNLHPSKRLRVHSIADSLETVSVISFSDEEISEPDSNDDDEEYEPQKEKEYQKLDQAVQLQLVARLSLPQTQKIIKNLTGKSPSASGIMKRSLKHKEKMIEQQDLSQYHVLHYDMKNMVLYGKKRELIAIAVSNPEYGSADSSKMVCLKEIPNKSSEKVYGAILEEITKFPHGQFSVLCSDTEPVNTGRRNGVAMKIKDQVPNFHGCRLHILDLVLRAEFKHEIGERTIGPDMNYDATVVESYREQCGNYNETASTVPVPDYDLPQAESRRDDYRLLLKLVKALRFFWDSGLKANVSFPAKPPPRSNARWNSRAIYALIAQLVFGIDLTRINHFIVYYWSPAWFGVRHRVDWDALRAACCEAGKNVLDRNHCSGMENKPLTNEVCERIFSVLNMEIAHSKSLERLSLNLTHRFNFES